MLAILKQKFLLLPSLTHCRNASSSPTAQRKEHSLTKEWCMSDFELGCTLGKGAFGAVWLAREKTSQFITALKCIRKSVLIESGMEMQLRRCAGHHSIV